MKSLLKDISLYFSAFVPMYFLIVVKFCFGLLSGTIEINALSIIILSFYSFLVIGGILGILFNTIWNRENSKKIIITSQQNLTDQHFLGYFSLFVLFALTFELTRLSMFVVSIFIIIFIGIVYINNKMFYINPLLNLMGFNFYEIQYKEINQNEEKPAKMFYRGKLIIDNKPCFVKLEKTNFSFVDKNKK
ncbi:MAG: hypothetical protein PHS54_04970 [Clostridia bacterium]|nr:hypothetical protein [Clostridia bacterium]